MVTYDRWGNLVITKLSPKVNNPDDGWDGYFNGQKQNPDVFVCSIGAFNGTDNLILSRSLTLVL